MPFVAALVVMANRQQPRVFALRARVRLHADRIIAGQLNQPVGELGNHSMIAFGPVNRAERMQFGEFRP